MGIMVLVQADIKPEFTSEMKSFLDKILPDTRAYDGCNFIDVYFDVDNENNMVLVEQWDSREHYKKYHEWRTETGVIDKIRNMVDGSASIRFFEKADA
ncbi:MAG: hypothetical protein GWO07_08680 [Candidatus Dadabacteria bacterium]|nr:hypothetical protein [Candidatus Dadabacteria bacterium]NIS08822.1 hypothetical protein [Candidatus Dadabacteria bacterium]NIY22172.1 hypothetical protein [Candidatus Dadabacteria bacterium]